MNKTALTIFALLTVASLAATDDDKIRYLQHLKNMPISAEDAPKYFALTNGGFAFYRPPVIRDDLVRMAKLDEATVDAWLTEETKLTPREQAIVHGIIESIKASGGDVTKLDASEAVTAVEVKASDLKADAKLEKDKGEPVLGEILR